MMIVELLSPRSELFRTILKLSNDSSVSYLFPIGRLPVRRENTQKKKQKQKQKQKQKKNMKIIYFFLFFKLTFLVILSKTFG